MAKAIRTTLVTFPNGATEGSSTVLGVYPLADGASALIAETTPFHPLDQSWPDQPGDRGVLEHEGARLAVLDCLTGALGPDGRFAVGPEIPVRRGDAEWEWLVVHVLEAGSDPGDLVGRPVVLRADARRRAALSAAHTGCHLLAFALDEALAGRWGKPVRTDSLGAPDFDGLAMESSRMDEHASTDRYRIGKTLRKKGFDAEGLREALPELTERVNARLADWIATDAPVRIETAGPELTARRKWVCTLPQGTAMVDCGGTHVTRLSELGSVTTELSLSEDGTELLAITTPKRD